MSRSAPTDLQVADKKADDLLRELQQEHYGVTLQPVDAHADDSVLSREYIASMWMMRRDLEAAGIPFADAQGRRVDFHSLRGTLNSQMALAKVDPQLLQKIMRHSDIKVTLDTYTDSTLLKVSEAIIALPAFAENATLCATNLDISRHSAASGGTTSDFIEEEKVPENE